MVFSSKILDLLLMEEKILHQLRLVVNQLILLFVRTLLLYSRWPSQKEISIPTIHFQVQTVSFREGRMVVAGSSMHSFV